MKPIRFVTILAVISFQILSGSKAFAEAFPDGIFSVEEVQNYRESGSLADFEKIEAGGAEQQHVLAEMMIRKFDEEEPDVAPFKKQEAAKILKKHFDTMTADEKFNIYQLAFRMAIESADGAKATEMIQKGTQGNYELSKTFICNSIVDLGTDGASGFEPELLKNSHEYAANYLPYIAKLPGLSKENCNLGDEKNTEMQLKDLVKIASPQLASKLSEMERNALNTNRIVGNDSVVGCSERNAGFILRKTIFDIEKFKVGTFRPMDEVYEQCRIRGILLKSTKQTYVFVGGSDLKTSPRTSDFHNSDDGTPMIMSFQKR